MDAQIDFSSSRSGESSDKKNVKSGGSSGRMNGGDPLNNGVSVGDAGSVLGWILAAFGSTASFLFYRLNKANEDRLAEHKILIGKLEETCSGQQKQIDECTTDRTELRVTVAGLEKDVEFLKSKVQA